MGPSLSLSMAVGAPILEQLTRALTPLPPGVVAVYLYGSFARGTPTDRSDVDLGLLYEQPPPATYHGQPYLLEGHLTEQLERPVQLVVLNGAPVDLVHRVLRDAILLFDENPAVRVAFEVRARNLYFDLLPYLLQYRRMGKAS